jgi:hypothetical protein
MRAQFSASAISAIVKQLDASLKALPAGGWTKRLSPI